MTQKLYYEDAYIKEFEATVLLCERTDGGYEILLDRTAFFPNEGGQYADSGFIGEAPVKDVRERKGIIYHYAQKEVEVGSRVRCRIDFEERFDKMQQHTAEHILSGIIHRLYGLDNVGFHLGPDEVTMDVSAPLTDEQLDRVEREANEAVYKNLSVSASFPSAKELVTLEYRSKLELTEDVRIVTVDGVDACACCAPHVASTGEIGLIKILRRESLRGGIRLWIAAGKRAYADYVKKSEQTDKISTMLSAPVNEVSAAVSALNDSVYRLKADIKRLEDSLVRNIQESFDTTDRNALMYLPDLSTDALRTLSKLLISRVGGILVLLTGARRDYKYVIASEKVDLREAAKDFNKALLGKGGGRSEMVQGSFGATLEQIKEYFRA